MTVKIFHDDCRETLRTLPDNSIDSVITDPPHVNFGANAEMSKTYGHHTSEDIRSIVSGSAKEAHRVSKPDALMAFKWNNHDQSFNKVLALMSEWWEPLFGHATSVRTKHNCQTQWVMLRRRNSPKMPWET